MTAMTAWQSLREHHAAVKNRSISELFEKDKDRARFSAICGDMLFDFSKTNIDDEILDRLIDLAGQAGLADRFPDTTIIVNHAGSPIDRAAADMDHWRRGLKELARRPNVRLKISDLCAYDHDWTLESLRPVVLDCLDAFGPGRAMFASDFPVAGLHAGYAEMYAAFADIVQGLTAAEQRALFHDNAVRDYRIDKTDSRP